MPTWEGGEEEKAEECENDGDDAVRGVSDNGLCSRDERRDGTHIKYGNTILSLNVDATQIRFSGS